VSQKLFAVKLSRKLISSAYILKIIKAIISHFECECYPVEFRVSEPTREARFQRL